MESPAVIADLRPLARMRRVYFDVMPEIAFKEGARVKVGYLVRLWAVHARGARALPGCGECRELVNDLRRLFEHVVPPAPAGSTVDLDPFRPALYESRIVPGADEVALTLRLLRHGDGDQPVDAAGERWLKSVRDALRSLEIAER